MDSFKNDKAYIIAEAGNNHEGSLERAIEMVSVASECGADAIKFQAIDPYELVSESDTERIKALKKFKLSFGDYSKLAKVCSDNKIDFLSTPFDIKSAELLNNIQDSFKIASGDNNFFPLIEKVFTFNKTIYISLGILEEEQLLELVNFLDALKKKYSSNQKICLLHCISSYPADNETLNLKRIQTLKKKFNQFVIGYSDHSIGILATSHAVAMGAEVIEKHFTLDKNLSDFRDHKLSADPDELKIMIQNIRMIESMLGDGIIGPQISEHQMMIDAKRSIVARKDIPKNTIITQEHIKWIRPGDGIPPSKTNEILGKVAKVDISAETKIIKDFIS